MSQAFDEKLVKLDNVSSLHNDVAHLVNAFANVANRERKFEEEEAMNNRASALRKEASRYGRGEITPWFWWTALGVEVVASVLLIPLYRLVYWVFEMISKTLDWAFKTLARVATSTARFCITSLTWWCGLFAPRKETPESTSAPQDEQA